MPGFWTHQWQPIQFTLEVDDFGVKYTGKEHANHLMSAMKEDNEIFMDWEGSHVETVLMILPHTL